MARINTTVHVHFPDGTSQAFGPEDEVPSEAAALIEAESVWADAPADDKPKARNTRAKKA